MRRTSGRRRGRSWQHDAPPDAALVWTAGPIRPHGASTCGRSAGLGGLAGRVFARRVGATRQRGRRVERGRASRRGSRRRTRQRAPLNARLATVAKPCSSSRRASSRCAMRSPDGRSAASALTHQQSTRRPPGRTSSAPASPTTQTPRRPRSRDEPGAARAGRARRGRRGRRAGRRRRAPAPRRPAGAGADVRAAAGVELGDHPGVHERHRPRPGTRAAPAPAAAPRSRRTARCGRRSSASTARPRRRSRAASSRGRQ